MKEWHPLLKGAIELHSHSSPSIFPRRQNDWELIEDVYQSKMSGIVLKAHEGATYDRATLLKEKYPELEIFGGLVCNLFTGGLSYQAVDMALRMGAKIIWMPTLSAMQHQKYFADNIKKNIFNSQEQLNNSFEGLTVTTTDNKIKDEVKKILSLIASHNAVLATGHLKSNEVLLLVDEAIKLGVKNILIQHADLGIAPLSLDEQVSLANKGCLIEKCYLACGEDFNNITVGKMAESIKKIGDENCVLVTDYGQAHNIPVIEGLQEFILKLLSEKISEQSIEVMININPKKLLNI